MKRHLPLAVLMLAVAFGAGCDDDNPNDPSETPPTFSFALSPANEVPPVTGADANAAGTVTIRMNLTRDAANNITDASWDFQISVSGVPAGSTITAAHIHEAPAGQNATFVVNVGIVPGELALVNGAGSITKNGLNSTGDDAALAQRILNNPANFYFNVHSTANGGGVLRAQLVRTN